MKSLARRTALLGDLVAAAFDAAARLSADPFEISRLATLAVQHMLHRGRCVAHAPAVHEPPPV